MKVLLFIQSLFVPGYMVRRKNMNVFISFLLLIAFSVVVALPMINYFSKDRYTIMESSLNLKAFNYVIDENSTVGMITDEERATYNMVYYSDIKKLGIMANKKGLAYQDELVNGQEYVLKSYIPILDEEGTITNYETYYIHIVVDDYDINSDESATYDITNNFLKLKREPDNSFHHLLIAFYSSGAYFAYSDEATQLVTLTYGDNEIYLSEGEDATYLSHNIIDLLYRVYQYKATLRSFIFVFALPILFTIVFSWIFGRFGALKGFREYLAVGTIVCMNCTIVGTILSFINMQLCNYVFNYFSFAFIAYYLVTIMIINRRHRIHMD